MVSWYLAFVKYLLISIESHGYFINKLSSDHLLILQNRSILAVRMDIGAKEAILMSSNLEIRLK